jgi:uncharacterized protein
MMQGRMIGMFFMVVVVFLLQSGCTQTQTPERQAAVKGAAVKIVDQITKGSFAESVKDFDDTMVKALPPEKLNEAWQSLIQSQGSFQKTNGERVTREHGYDIVYIQCQFEKGKIDAKVVFNADTKVSGLFFVPAQ